MVENNGKVYVGDLTNLSTEEKIENAKVFAEGSKELEEILLLLWNNGLQTIGSCAGHDGSNIPYIAFYANTLNDKQLRKILTELCSMNDIFRLKISQGRIDRPTNLSISLKKDINANFGAVLEAMKAVLETNFDANYYREKYNNLPELDRQFIEDAITLSKLNVREINVSDLFEGNMPETIKGFYEIEKVCESTILAENNNNYKINHTSGIKPFSDEFDEVKYESYNRFNKENPWYETTAKVHKNCYTTINNNLTHLNEDNIPVIDTANNRYFILDENNKAKEVSFEEIQQMGLMEDVNYSMLISNSIPKGRDLLNWLDQRTKTLSTSSELSV